MLYADTDTNGRNTEPSPDATGRCPLCGGRVLARCGRVNAWHWAHRAREDCDTWAEPANDWHRAYQRIVPSERCEVVKGRHRADIEAATGHVVELQRSSISGDEIAEREAHYGQGMVWLFDVREAYEAGRLSIHRGHTEDSVTFQWRQPRRSISLCQTTLLLDLGEGLSLKVTGITEGASYGSGQLFETVEIWRWMRDGTKPSPLCWPGYQHSELVARIIRTMTYLKNRAIVSSGDELSRVIKAALFAGNSPRDPLRAALNAARASVDLTGLGEHADLRPRWVRIGLVEVRCWCGELHQFREGPVLAQRWRQWVDDQTWPLDWPMSCPANKAPIKVLRLEAPPAGSWGSWNRPTW